MRTFQALRQACAVASAALAFTWAGNAWSLSCSRTITIIDYAGLGLVELPSDLPTADVEILRSPSGAYRMTADRSGDPLAVRLYRNETLVSSFRRPLPSTLEFLLDDGTYLAFERPADCVSKLDQDIVAVSAAGIVLWRHEARSLVPEHYRTVYENPALFGAALSWMVDVQLVGSGLDDAKLSVRLSNHDLLEISARDARTRYVEISDLGADSAAWNGRGYWYYVAGDLEQSLQNYLRARALNEDDTGALHHILEIYERRKRYDLVETELEAAIARRPLASARAGGAHYTAGIDAGQTLGHPIRLRRELAAAHVARGDVARALALLDEVLLSFPNDWWTNVDRANLLIDAGNREQLRAHIENVYRFYVATIDGSNESEPNKRAGKANVRQRFLDWLLKQQFSDQAAAMLREDLEAAGPQTSAVQTAWSLEQLAEAAKAQRNYAEYVEILTQADRLSPSGRFAARLADFYLGHEGHAPDFRAALRWQLRAHERETQQPAPGLDPNFRLCYLSYAAAEPRSWSAGVEWCRRGAEAGEPPASFWLALLLLQGDVIPRDVAAAEELLTRARPSKAPFFFDAMSAPFNFELHDMHDDLAPFVPALEAHAARGSASAAFLAGRLYLYGQSVPKNAAIALRWFEQGAKQGDKEAQYQLGTLLASRGDARAIEWFEAAAAQGHSFAAYDLGGIYYEGTLTPRNLPMAKEWLERSARLYDAEWPMSRPTPGSARSPALRQLREWFPNDYPEP